jgi:hypothetical protein
MSLSALPTELQLQIMLSLDCPSVVRLGSADHHFRAMQMILSNTQKRDSLLRLEIFDSEDHLKKRGLFPCYGCFHVLPKSAFLDFSHVPAFDIGGRYATHRLCGTTKGRTFFASLVEIESIAMTGFETAVKISEQLMPVLFRLGITSTCETSPLRVMGQTEALELSAFVEFVRNVRKSQIRK